ncbi:hypothetical protein [Streptomyces sp. NPDC060184]|uniref:hypothetical protein n=1 Tax=Streptomyces sp. NPDC060184 TaxID=3347064 RepID=UPI003655F0BD
MSTEQCDVDAFAQDVLAATERFPWAVAAPGERHWPDGEFPNVALHAVRPEERDGYVEHLEAFSVEHRARLEELLRAYGPGTRRAVHGGPGGGGSSAPPMRRGS